MINCRATVLSLLIITFAFNFANSSSTRGKLGTRGKRSESFEISASHDEVAAGWSKSVPDISEDQHLDVSITEPVNKVRHFWSFYMTELEFTKLFYHTLQAIFIKVLLDGDRKMG